MNLSLSNKLRAMNPRFFFDFRVDQPCWYAVLERGERRRQYKWRVGVKYLGETEEHTFGVTCLKTDDDAVWADVCSESFAAGLVEAFRLGGKKAVSERLKDEVA